VAKKVVLETIGCKVNQYETEAVAQLFRQRGYEIVSTREEADIYILNTCTVTSASDRKSRQAIRRFKRDNPQGIVAAMGCYVQEETEEVRQIPEVDVLVGVAGRDRIVDLVEEAMEGQRQELILSLKDSVFEELPFGTQRERTRAFLKVQDGCDNYCTYCKVRLARGPSRSRSPASVFREVETLVDGGYREIVLTGVHLGGYGRDLDGRWDLARLLKDLASIPGLDRLRISSVDPQEVTPQLLAVIADSHNICPHLHIPLQSGSNRILKAMGRRYTREEYLDIIAEAKGAIPRLAVTTDIIVGFPGEGEGDFQETIQLVEEVGFSRLHVFTYSPRAGTPAAKLQGQLPKAVKEERSRRLIALGKELQHAFHRSLVGTKQQVIVEGVQGQGYEGLTDQYVRVLLPGSQELIGQMVLVEIAEAHREYVVGKLV
jgi:threonylcarbamoyladenosine tRNA methylthiotransferase MtaB